MKRAVVQPRLAGIHQLIQNKIAIQCANNNYVSIPFYCVAATLAMCLMIFGKAFSAYEILPLSLFLTTAPNLLLWRFELGPALALQVVFISALAICLKSLSLYLVASIAAVSVAYTLFLIVRNIKNEMGNWPSILGCLIFTFLNFKLAFRLNSPYVDPTDIVNNSILNGQLDTDGSMHMAIVNMILHQFVPSTGLHLAPYMPYHYLGHFLVAVATAISGLKVYDVYYSVTPFLHTPYILFLFLMVAKKVGKRSGSLLLVPVFLFGITLGKIHPWYWYEDHPWYFESDLTYPVGIIMMLSFLLLALNKTRTRLVFAVMSAAYFAKVSVGLAVSASYALINHMEALSWKRKIANLMIAISISLASFFCIYTPGIKGEGAFQWGAFYYLRAIQKSSPPSVFLWHHFSFSFIFLGLMGMLLLTEGRRALSERRPLILCWTATAALGAVIFNLRLTAGAQYYFINIAQWLLLPVIAALAWDMLWYHNRIVRLSIAIGLLTLSLPLVKLARSRLSLYRHYQEFHRLAMAKNIKMYDEQREIKMPSLEKRTKRFIPYYTALLAAGEYDKHNNYLIEVPESEMDFWQHSIYPSPRYWMAFQIPAISGRPAWNGYNRKFMKNTSVAGYPPGAYGYGIYYRSDITDPCRNGRYHGILRIAKDAAGIVKQSIITCPL